MKYNNIIIKYSGSCPCLCLVNNVARQADNIVITCCSFICVPAHTFLILSLSDACVYIIGGPSPSRVYFFATAAVAFTAVRSRYLAVVLAFMRHQHAARAPVDASRL